MLFIDTTSGFVDTDIFPNNRPHEHYRLVECLEFGRDPAERSF